MSALHRIASDEVWHHYAGGALTVHVLHPSGRHEVLRLGLDLAAGEDGHRLPARFLDPVARAHGPEAVPIVLAIRPPEPGKEHLLARGQHPEDEPGQRIA